MQDFKGKRLYIENLGCAKNQVDAEVMLNNLVEAGFVSVEDASLADLILVNTCGFIDIAKEESINTFFELKNSYPKAKVVLTGCLAQRYASSLKDELIEADGIFGNRDLSKITYFINRLYRGERAVELPPYPLIEDETTTRSKLFNYPGSAYLKISEGCNHFCRYCAIPLIRGNLRSRPLKAIIAEAKELVESGVKELNLIAQDLASYATDTKESNFLELLTNLVEIEGDFKIRMLYIHPDYFPLKLIDFVKQNEKVAPYFDIPFQHAHKDVLRAMGRKGDRQTYLDLVNKIRSVIPEATIRSTIMLGFINENEETIGELKLFLKEAELDWVGSFIYSREEETAAYLDRSEQEHLEVIKKAKSWQKEIETLQQEITQKRLSRFVGTVEDVLIEELVENEDLAIGRIKHQAPEVDGLTVVLGENLVAGTVVKCGIRRVNGIDLEAIPIT
jgi:ribosomal protein S12 methylthiotransferase